MPESLGRGSDGKLSIDKELQQLDVDDSRENGALIAGAQRHLVSPADHARLDAVANASRRLVSGVRPGPPEPMVRWRIARVTN